MYGLDVSDFPDCVVHVHRILEGKSIKYHDNSDAPLHNVKYVLVEIDDPCHHSRNDTAGRLILNVFYLVVYS